MYEIGTSPFFTSIHPGEAEDLVPDEFVPGPGGVPDTPEDRRPERPVNPPYVTVTESDYDKEETRIPATRVPPVYPAQFPVYPEPTETKPADPEPKRPQPERPQVVVVDTDDLDVDGESFCPKQANAFTDMR